MRNTWLSFRYYSGFLSKDSTLPAQSAFQSMFSAMVLLYPLWWIPICHWPGILLLVTDVIPTAHFVRIREYLPHLCYRHQPCSASSSSATFCRTYVSRKDDQPTAGNATHKAGVVVEKVGTTFLDCSINRCSLSQELIYFVRIRQSHKSHCRWRMETVEVFASLCMISCADWEHMSFRPSLDVMYAYTTCNLALFSVVPCILIIYL